jgi:hypothetical protein
LPVITGFITNTQNFPATVQNSGFEFSLTSYIAKSKKFNWTLNFNMTVPRNELIAFPGLSESGYANVLVIGQPVSVIKGFRFAGVNTITGIYQFTDSHGKTTSDPDPLADNTALINTLPKYYGGLQNTFTYKAFRLDFLFQFVKQIGHNIVFGNTNAVMPGYYASGAGTGNQPTTIVNRWQNPGDVRTVQKYNSDFSAFLPWLYATSSDAAYSDASYIRLKNLSISWQLCEHWKKTLHLQSCQVYLQAQNLLTFTSYKGLDPENQNTASLPPLRILSAGIQISL